MSQTKKNVKRLPRRVSTKGLPKPLTNWLWLLRDVTCGEVVPKPITPIYPKRFKIPIRLVLLEKKWPSTIMEN